MEAEDRYDLSDECNDFFRQSIDSAENSRFAGISASNKTRWNSDAKMGKSHLQNKGVPVVYWDAFFPIYFLSFPFDRYNQALP